MEAEAGKRLLVAVQTEPTDEETLQAMMILVKRLMPRSTDSASSATRATPDAWLTPAAAAKYAAVSEDTLRAWISSGQLRSGRVGRVIRIRRSDVDVLLEGQAGSGAADECTTGQRVGEVSDASRSILTSLHGKQVKKR